MFTCSLSELQSIRSRTRRLLRGRKGTVLLRGAATLGHETGTESDTSTTTTVDHASRSELQRSVDRQEQEDDGNALAAVSIVETTPSLRESRPMRSASSARVKRSAGSCKADDPNNSNRNKKKKRNKSRPPVQADSDTVVSPQQGSQQVQQGETCETASTRALIDSEDVCASNSPRVILSPIVEEEYGHFVDQAIRTAFRTIGPARASGGDVVARRLMQQSTARRQRVYVESAADTMKGHTGPLGSECQEATPTADVLQTKEERALCEITLPVLFTQALQPLDSRQKKAGRKRAHDVSESCPVLQQLALDRIVERLKADDRILDEALASAFDVSMLPGDHRLSELRANTFATNSVLHELWLDGGEQLLSSEEKQRLHQSRLASLQRHRGAA